MFLLHGVLLALAADPQPPPTPCDTPAHHAFDFWVGEWDQHWQVTPADAEWATVFDGTYQPTPPASPQVSP